MAAYKPDPRKAAQAAIYDIGRQVRVRRVALGLSQVALAKRARWSRSRLIDLENGKSLAGVGFGKLSVLLHSLGMELALMAHAAGRPLPVFGPEEVELHRRNAIRISPGQTKLHLPSLK